MRPRLIYAAIAAAIALSIALPAARADETRDRGRQTFGPFVTRPFPAMRPHPADLTLKRGHVEIALRNASPALPRRQFCCIFTGPPLDAVIVSPGAEEEASAPQVAAPPPATPAAAQIREAPVDETVGRITILRGGAAP